MSDRLPTVPGGAIQADTVADLQSLSVNLFTLGTRVYVLELNQFFALKVATNGGYPVSGITGYRWLPDNGGGGGALVLASDMWVSPAGSNVNPGTQEEPKNTISAAYIAAYPGGVRIHTAAGSKWSDGTENWASIGAVSIVDNNMWLRQDSFYTVLPGWLPIQQFEIVGWGLGSTTQFGQPYAALDIGGVTTRTPGNPDRINSPSLWITSGGTAFRFKEVGWISRLPARIGMDYLRNTNLSLSTCAITNASRVPGGYLGGLTTLTLTLPTGYTVSQLTQQANELTARVNAPTAYLVGGRLMTITPGSGSGAGFTTVTAAIKRFAQISSVLWDVVFDNTAANIGTTVVTGAAAKGHMMAAGDLIDIVSSSSQFPTTMYQVASVPDATHVVVHDPNGIAPQPAGARTATASAANIGTCVLSVRGGGIAFDEWERCSIQTDFSMGPGNERFNFGPTIDHGGNNSFGTYIERGYYAGCGYDDGTSFHQGIRDPNRNAAWLLWSGSIGACAIKANAVASQNGQCRWQPGLDFGGLEVNGWIQDTSSGTFLRPCIDLPSDTEGGGFTTNAIELHNCQNADNAGGNGDVDFGFSSGVAINCGIIKRAKNSIVLHDVSRQNVDSFDASGILGWEPDSSILSGQRWDVHSQFGVYQGLGLTNLVPEDISTWTNDTGATVTVTGGQPSPDGSANAFSLAAPGTGNQRYKSVNVGTIAPGDYFIAGLWVKSPISGFDSPVGNLLWLNLSAAAGASLSDTIVASAPPRSGNGEWQWLNLIGVADAGAAGWNWATLHVYTPQSSVPIVIDGAFMIRIPVGTMAKNDVYRLWRTLRHVPAYALPSGAAGTRAGQKLIGHGGLGAKPLVVGGASGQVTLGAAVAKCYPFFDDTGALVGYVQPLAGTVNP